MHKPKFNPAMIELRDAITEAETITAKAEVSKRDELRLNVLLAKIAALRNSAVAPNEDAKRFLKNLFLGRPVEQRGTDLLAGQQTPTYTQGPEGGFSVPQAFQEEIIYGMAQFDPLVDPDLVSWIFSDSILRLRPLTVPGWDLSRYAAVPIGETQQQNPQTVPAVAKLGLGGANAQTYRASLDGSFEFEEDAFEVGLKLAENAFSIGMARGIGKALITGSGSGAPQGVLTGSVQGAVALNPSKLVLDDFESLYFSVDRIYRVSDKCAWVMNDSTYKQVRRAVDNNGRPLINIRKDKEEIMGKPVLVSPSMPAFAASANVIVFGDLGHYVVYSSNLRVVRSSEAPGYVEYGKALYTALMRVDAGVFDPTAGSFAPLKYLTMSS